MIGVARTTLGDPSPAGRPWLPRRIAGRAARSRQPATARPPQAAVVLAPMLASVLAVLPPLVAWMAYGMLILTDSHGYMDYAAALRAGTVATGPALLRQAAVPVTLFRMTGYPAILAGLQAAFAQGWPTALVMLQIGANAMVAATAYRACLALRFGPCRAMVAAVLPACGFALVLQICVLTDALYAALLGGAALLLVARPTVGCVAVAAVALAAATAIREATVFLAIGYIPLAVLAAGPAWRRRLAAAALVVALSWGVAAAQIGWNISRGVGSVLTTSPQTVLVQAVLPLVQAGYPVFDGDDMFDATARSSLAAGDYAGIDTLHQRLFAQGMASVDMAKAASRAYWRTWRRFPTAMAAAALANLRPRYLAMPFQPLETLADLAVYAGDSRPVFGRFNEEWRMLRHGQVAAGLWVAVDLVTRMAGIAISLAAMAQPWRRGADPRLRGLWCVCATLIAVYTPVHVEPRYLAPLTPLVWVLGMAALPGRANRRDRPAPRRLPV